MIEKHWSVCTFYHQALARTHNSLVSTRSSSVWSANFSLTSQCEQARYDWIGIFRVKWMMKMFCDLQWSVFQSLVNRWEDVVNCCSEVKNYPKVRLKKIQAMQILRWPAWNIPLNRSFWYTKTSRNLKNWEHLAVWIFHAVSNELERGYTLSESKFVGWCVFTQSTLSDDLWHCQRKKAIEIYGCSKATDIQ